MGLCWFAKNDDTCPVVIMPRQINCVLALHNYLREIYLPQRQADNKGRSFSENSNKWKSDAK